MIKELGGVTLPTSLDWPDRYGSSGCTGITRTMLNGSAVTFGPVPQPQKITLISGDDFGWFTLEQANDLLALLRLPGPHVLHWGDLLIKVAFDFQQNAIALKPLYPNAVYLNGSVSLIKVEE